MSPADDFERTLDALGEERADVEQRYFSSLQELRQRVARLLEAAERAEVLASEGPVPPPRATLSSPDSVVDSAADSATPVQAGQEPWPSAGGWVRRRLNTASRWVLRDYLAALDRRHEAIEAALTEVCQRLDARAAEARVMASALHDEACRAHDDLRSAGAAAESALALRLEAVREGLNRAGEALDLLSELAERSRLLNDAKDAETLQRAAHGPLRKMEVVFDEFARQQEALLSELVGRRRDLDRLIAELRQDLSD